LVHPSSASGALGVEVRERLVHEEHRGAPDDRPGEGDTLPLTAGELPRLTIEELAILGRDWEAASGRRVSSPRSDP